MLHYRYTKRRKMSTQPAPYIHDLAPLVRSAVYSNPIENMTPSRPLAYSHWNWYANELLSASLGTLNSLAIP
jgi:hypothetical protein